MWPKTFWREELITIALAYSERVDDRRKDAMGSGDNPYQVTSLGPGLSAETTERRSSFPRALNFGLQVFVENFLAILTVIAIIWIPLELVQAYCDYFVFDEDDFRSTRRLQRAFDGLFGIIATGGVLAIGNAAHRGERLSGFAALGEGLSAWPRLFWTRLICGLVLLAAFLALIIPFIYVGFRLMLLEAVVVVEHRSGMDGLKRAWQLADQRWWLITGLTVVTYGAIMIIGIGLFIPLAFMPAIDHWLVSAGLSLLVDLMAQVPTLVLLGAYIQAVSMSLESTMALPEQGPQSPGWAFGDVGKTS
jgi:hypothetical protein